MDHGFVNILTFAANDPNDIFSLDQVHLFGYGTYISDRAQILLLKDCLDFLGGDNMFKRYVFGDGKWLVTQGYSITIFEEPLTEKDLTKMVSLIGSSDGND